MENVVSPRRKKVQGAALQQDDVVAFMAAIRGHRFEPPMLFLLATGMRRGEVCGLRHRSVDRREKVATVSESRGEQTSPRDDGSREYSWVQKGTKTDQQRAVPLNALALKALAIEERSQKKHAKVAGSAWSKSGFAFVDELGEPISPDALSDAFRRAFVTVTRQTGRRYRLHDLRHTAATLMLAGGDLLSVRDVLGHASANTTLGIYGHSIEGGRRRAVDAIDRAVRPPK
jgi:integrase